MKNKDILYLTVLMIFMLLLIPATSHAAEHEEILVSDIFYDMFILDALSDLSAQTGVAIIADDTVSGFVTMEFENTPLEEALARICIPSGYIFRYMEQGYYLVGSPDPRGPSFQHMAVTEVIHLRYINEMEARDLLPVHYEDFLRSSRERDVITITATPEMIVRFRDDLAKIDTPSKQVHIQAVVTEISSEFLNEYGTDFFNLLSGDPNDEDFKWGLSFFTDGLEMAWEGPHAWLRAHLKALEREQKAEIRADPQVVVSDRGTANLFIGEEQVIILQPEGSSSRVERVEVGVSLEVTPRITGEGEIQLTFAPKISHFTEEIDRRLRIRRSEIETTLYAKDGETLMFAGMTVKGEETMGSKVPILGDIPLVRWLFRQVEEKETDRELLIFITPKII